MQNKLAYILIIFLSVNFTSFAQQSTSELITFSSNNFNMLLELIITPENNCASNRTSHNWYIEKLEDSSFLISINRIGNLLKSTEEQYIYTTIINKQIVFYITDDTDDNISKKGYFVDLSRYLDYEYVYFEDFSSWLITQRGDDFFTIKGKKIFKCN